MQTEGSRDKGLSTEHGAKTGARDRNMATRGTPRFLSGTSLCQQFTIRWKERTRRRKGTYRSNHRGADRRRVGKRSRPVISGTNRWASLSQLVQLNTIFNERILSSPNKLQVPTDPNSLYIRGTGNQLTVPLVLHSLSTHEAYPAKALIDSGCTGSVISQQFVDQHQMITRKLEKPILVRNADGTPNEAGSLTHFVEI